ncbi:VanZ family protein [Snodgrassella sp. CFCC 13594]|uniref:VanZ family protein n=1 Tax=Snodgrassella sp. CFCC 13594 TaxID=1775559 RepID=UPI0008368C4C|nr:VanZ family protein [Snodgrassella sp. CFCC 13594]
MAAGRVNQWFGLAAVWFWAGIYALFFKDGGGPAPFPHFDKASHFALFFVQMWLLAKGFFSQGRPIPWRTLMSCALVWAVGSEMLQGLFTTTRQAEVLDGVADVCGAALALWLAQQVAQARQRKG